MCAAEDAVVEDCDDVAEVDGEEVVGADDGLDCALLWLVAPLVLEPAELEPEPDMAAEELWRHSRQTVVNFLVWSDPDS